jgi:hypothetical protein
MTPSQLRAHFLYQFRELDKLPPWRWERWRGSWEIFVRLCRQVDEALGEDNRRIGPRIARTHP